MGTDPIPSLDQVNECWTFDIWTSVFSFRILLYPNRMEGNGTWSGSLRFIEILIHKWQLTVLAAQIQYCTNHSVLHKFSIVQIIQYCTNSVLYKSFSTAQIYGAAKAAPASPASLALVSWGKRKYSKVGDTGDWPGLCQRHGPFIWQQVWPHISLTDMHIHIHGISILSSYMLISLVLLLIL